MIFPELFCLRDFRDFYQKPRSEWSVRERFYHFRLERPFWNCHRGSGAGVFFIPVYSDRVASKIVYPIYRVGLAVNDALWWLKYRLIPSHRYHVVPTGLSPRYYDHDTRMLHACMWLLGDFLANDDHHEEGESKTEARAIWAWWMIELPANERRREELMHLCFGGGRSGQYAESVPGTDLVEIKFRERSAAWTAQYDEFKAVEKKICDDELSYMHRLINIRTSLWT